jgi:hypothetical protein
MEEGTSTTVPLEPPPLPYSLRTRKKSIAIFWTIFVLDTLAQPLVLYWALWFATDLSHNVGKLSALVVGAMNLDRLLIPAQSMNSLLYRHCVPRRCLRLRILLPSLSLDPKRFKDSTIERKKIMGRLEKKHQSCDNGY